MVFASTQRLRDDELTRLLQWRHKDAGVGTAVRKDRLFFSSVGHSRLDYFEQLGAIEGFI